MLRWMFYFLLMSIVYISSVQANDDLLKELKEISRRSVYVAYKYDVTLFSKYLREKDIAFEVQDTGSKFTRFVLASDYEGKAVFAEYQHDDYDAEDIQLLIQAGKSGEPQAFNVLGVLYSSGRDVKQDYEKSQSYYMRAAEMGYSLAHSNLGMSYFDGRLGKPDYEKAYKHFVIAGEQGDTTAACMLSKFYQEGFGVVKSDKEKAEFWYRKGAKKTMNCYPMLDK